jgi:hypothetical protein
LWQAWQQEDVVAAVAAVEAAVALVEADAAAVEAGAALVAQRQKTVKLVLKVTSSNNAFHCMGLSLGMGYKSSKFIWVNRRPAAAAATPPSPPPCNTTAVIADIRFFLRHFYTQYRGWYPQSTDWSKTFLAARKR